MFKSFQGFIEKEKVDSFNLPLYEPSPEELMLEIEREGSFVLHHQAICQVDWDAMDTDQNTNEEMGTTTTAIKGECAARNIRAAAEPLLKEHFGEKVMDNLFQRFGDLLRHVPRDNAKFSFITISLIRNGKKKPGGSL